MKLIVIISSLFYVLSYCSAQEFHYDDINRLIETDYGQGYVIIYSYDKLGNRTSRVVQAGCREIVSDGAYLQSFENGIGDWKQLESDDRNWAHQSGGTATISTGPSSATDASTYLFTEATSRTNKTFIIESQCFAIPTGSSSTLSLDYHMYGVHVGALQVQVSVNNGSFATLLTKSGDQGNTWNQFMQSLSAYAGSSVRFRIVATTGGGGRSDIAIDNIRIGSACPDNLFVSNTLNNSFTSLPGEEHLARLKVTSTATLNTGAYHFGAQEIDMNVGFEVKNGVQFVADDQGCVSSSNLREKEEVTKE